jgi:hypothetical protein
MKSKPAVKPAKAVKTAKPPPKPAKPAKQEKPAPKPEKAAPKREEPVIPVTEKCERCNGQGCIPVLCPKCAGRPSLTHENCKKCKGIGFVDATCRICQGSGEAPDETEETDKE